MAHTFSVTDDTDKVATTTGGVSPTFTYTADNDAVVDFLDETTVALSAKLVHGANQVSAKYVNGLPVVARVERCGRIAMGQYCMHLHLVGPCASCAFVGNVVEGGVNKGITVHGTHDALVAEVCAPLRARLHRARGAPGAEGLHGGKIVAKDLSGLWTCGVCVREHARHLLTVRGTRGHQHRDFLQCD